MMRIVPNPSRRVKIGSDPRMMVSQISCDPDEPLVDLKMARRRSPTTTRGSATVVLVI
jgi:hypothetical protein